MQSHMSIGFIFLAIGGLLGQQIQEFCDDHYCYRTDGELKNVTSLKDAQDYCTNNDNSRWLLEIYGLDSYQNLITKGFTNPIICNSVGTVAFGWTSVIDTQLPTGITVDETLGSDFLYLSLIGGQLSFFGADINTQAFYICGVPGNCSGGYCYEIWNTSLSWFRSESYCYTNQATVDKDYGHLATFDGMTYEEISNLSVVNKLTENKFYWIGYSQLVYTLKHSNIRNYFLLFDNPYPLLTSSSSIQPMYFVFFDTGSNDNRERAMGSDQFQIICMIDNSTKTTTEQASTTSITSSATTGLTSITVTPVSDYVATATTGQTNITVTPVSESINTVLLSLLLPILLWLVFSISFICCILPYCINRNTRKETTIY